jgi:hypothetical protein
MMPKMMKGEEYERWRAKNLELNAGYTLKVGDRIKDRWWVESTVEKIVIWEGEPSVANHGALNVRLDDGTKEHYVWFGWNANFRVTRAHDEPVL